MDMAENEVILEEKRTNNKYPNSELQFVGNWFVDVGILGFINLMEEVYGWNLEELQDKLKKDSNVVYQGYFPFAYLFYHSKIRGNIKKVNVVRRELRALIEKRIKTQEELSKLKAKTFKLEKIPKKDSNKIEKLEEKILEFQSEVDDRDNSIRRLNEELNNEKKNFTVKIESSIMEIVSDSSNMFRSLEDEITNIIPDFDLNLPKDHRNFFLYNPKKDLFLSFMYLHYLMSEDLSKIKLIRLLKDKNTICDFLSLCYHIKIKPDHLVIKIEEMYLKDEKKNLITSFCIKEFCKDNKKEKEFKKFIEIIYKNIQKEYRLKGDLLSYESSPDSTANPFLYSPTEFFNVGYTKPLTLNEIGNGLRLKFPVYLLLLSFGNSFQFFGGRNLLFYTNNVNPCYAVNKKIKTKISQVGKRDSIFKVTWASVIDELIENKAKFSLENMYLIEFEGIENQKLKNVNYLGITKLQATILIDDTIRDSLNSNIKLDNGNTEWVWILEDFIKNKPLFPLILKYVVLRANNETNQKLRSKTLFYALSVDAQRSYLTNSKTNLFDSNFYQESENVVVQIKEHCNSMNLAYKNVSRVFKPDKKDKILQKLISTIKKQNKTAFVNVILKAMVEEKKKDPTRVKHITNYLFNNVLRNEFSWQNYALAITFGFI